ncbi:MAG TPA: elongation factor Ts [Candidatus Paceibacterota bacterium]
MQKISTEEVKKLRDRTGLSVMQCKKALDEADGDPEKALVILRKKSSEIADKKSQRSLGAGVITSYIHANNSVGAIVELSCETDFVAKNDEFKTLAYEIAMQVAATDPQFLKQDDISEDVKKNAREVFLKEIADKPEGMKEKIIDGKLDSYFAEQILLEQQFIKNPDLKIKDLINQATQKFGERIEIRRFIRFSTQN